MKIRLNSVFSRKIHPSLNNSSVSEAWQLQTQIRRTLTPKQRIKHQTVKHLTIKRLTIKQQIKQLDNQTDQSTTGSTADTGTNSGASITLETQDLGPVVVKVPKGWTKSPYNGGNFQGFNFVNPNNKNETMQVAYSPCAGCGYPDADPGTADPHPKNLIPHQNVTDSFIFNGGLSAGYAYSVDGNPNKGNGVLSMVQGEGYAYAEIVLPESKMKIASEVLNSFAFHGMY